jgi:hypothetical protein
MATVMFAVLFLNLGVLSHIVIGNEEAYDTEETATSPIFDLFYTISSDTGYHPEPSNFNFLFTIVAGMALGILISYRMIWRQR